MNIEAKGYEASFTRNEAWTLTMILKHDILSVLTDNHYKMYPNSFNQNRKEEVHLFRSFSYAIGRPDIFNEAIESVEKYLAKVHQEQLDEQSRKNKTDSGTNA
jgi:hypothetical protein